MAMSLLRDWCRGLDVDMHRALLVTGIPEGLEQAAIEAVLQPAFLPLGTFRLRNTRAMRDEKAKAALVEFVEDINHAAIPREIPGKDGVWRVLCRDRAEDTRVLRQMKRLLLDERPAQATVTRALGDTPTSPAWDTRDQGPEPAARKAGPAPGAARNARRGRRGRRSRARGNRLTQRGRKRGRGGRPPTSGRRESEDSSEESLGIVIEEISEEDLGGDGDQSALYATLQAAAKELIKKSVLQGEAEEGEGPREFLALVTVTDKAKKEEMEKEPPGAESISLNIEEEGSGVPDLVALLAVRDTSDEEPRDSDASERESQETGDQDKEGVDNPEFVAIVAYTDPSDPSAREEMLKIASVIESLGWSDNKDKKDALPEVLSVMSKDTSGTRVKVEEAGRQVDAMVLRKARDDGNLLECISTLAEPETPARGKKARRGLLAGWGDEEADEGGLLELVALLAAQDVAEVMKDEQEKAWEGGKFKCAKGNLGEVLALLAASENAESEEDSERASEEGSEDASEDTESEESEPEDRESRKPRAKRARTASRALGPAAAAPAPPGSRKTRGGGRGRGGRGVTPEKKAKEEAAGNKKKKGQAGAGAHAKAGEARGQPPTGSKSARGKKARRGTRLPPKCR
ncbi:paraneoplastic antigen-like protein 8B [Manis pentadactyla]|uniref:paraneoplastic antigen-like protein 8B n=1 Tax=Manis pentadactyla TaxID=143292 RepID=UPI00255CC563|nr:paraneoplastic antigen-like protein 8B [Manis pentadactyla]